jgi:hypothetical protein
MSKEMKKNLGKIVLVLAAVGIFFFYGKASGLFLSRLAGPVPPVYIKPVPDDWEAAKRENTAAIASHLEANNTHFEHFANYPVSKTDGIPLILLKLLPKVAPEFWGNDENFLSVMGLFNDERLVGYPFPRGIGFTALTREDPYGAIDYASFTCGGCHIGRVRLPGGNFEYLNGGVNSQFDVIGYRMRIVQTLNSIYGNETDAVKKAQMVIETFNDALEKTHAEDPNYFYNNSYYDNKRFDAEYEARQIDLFRENASATITQFVSHQEQAYEGWKIISEKYYPNIADRIVQGFPGMEDAIAFNAVSGYLGLKQKTTTKLFAPLALPRSHGITDIMVVWDQDSRNPRWNEDENRLINGGGQWNGHIPLPIYKNIAAQITLGFDNVDVTVSAHAEKLLDKIPPPMYPFDVNLDLARQGRDLFADNCATCHQPNNGEVYTQLGTDPGRAKIAGTIITVGAQASFSATAICGPDTTVEMDGQPANPCATYRGVSMEGKSRFVMTPPRVHNGYNALPLTGLWAQAPYLHNGSVPTLYHMLMPSERPDAYIKSQLDFDTEKVGFFWDKDLVQPSGVEEGYLYDTVSSPATSHAGHDQNISLDGVVHKLDWSDDEPGAMALIEFLKTL